MVLKWYLILDSTAAATLYDIFVDKDCLLEGTEAGVTYGILVWVMVVV